MKILVTGGAGFIGSALVRQLIGDTDHAVVNVDTLTYAGSLLNIAEVADSSRYMFEQVNVCDGDALMDVFVRHQPDAVVHLAAESHVDRTIDGPRPALDTNVVGTFTLLEVSRAYWRERSDDAHAFRMLHVSTDEVFGSLGATGAFNEDSRYKPNSPYSATKAAADHLVRAWYRTYGLPVVITNCSNNYGPYQFPEKLIPVLIAKGLAGEAMPIYGTGVNVRDWLYVDDHVRGLRLALENGRDGESYNFGGGAEWTNMKVAESVCKILDDLNPVSAPHRDLITLVEDRPGHDARYAIDAAKAAGEFGWTPQETFGTGLRRTVEWYLGNQDWCRSVLADTYDGGRLGLAGRARS